MISGGGTRCTRNRKDYQTKSCLDFLYMVKGGEQVCGLFDDAWKGSKINAEQSIRQLERCEMGRKMDHLGGE